MMIECHPDRSDPAERESGVEAVLSERSESKGSVGMTSIHGVQIFRQQAAKT